MRKVIQIAVAPYDGAVATSALCDDGTMWDLMGGRWVEMPAIPQDESKDPLAVAVGKLQTIRNRAEVYRDSTSDIRSACGATILGILDRE